MKEFLSSISVMKEFEKELNEKDFLSSDCERSSFIPDSIIILTRISIVIVNILSVIKNRGFFIILIHP